MVLKQKKKTSLFSLAKKYLNHLRNFHGTIADKNARKDKIILLYQSSKAPSPFPPRPSHNYSTKANTNTSRTTLQMPSIPSFRLPIIWAPFPSPPDWLLVKKVSPKQPLAASACKIRPDYCALSFRPESEPPSRYQDARHALVVSMTTGPGAPADGFLTIIIVVVVTVVGCCVAFCRFLIRYLLRLLLIEGVGY